MQIDMQAHWQDVYERKAPDRVSWFRPHLERSLDHIVALPVGPEARIVDIGGGASTLVDDLLAAGRRNVAVLDLSAEALAHSRARLGADADAVDWRVGDATLPQFEPQSVDVWHDRAVFHFLTDPADRAAYVEQVLRAVRPGGHVIVATFAPDGPDRCSGLPVQRYDADGIHAAFGAAFVKVGQAAEHHRTPAGGEQSFVYCFCRRAGSLPADSHRSGR